MIRSGNGMVTVTMSNGNSGKNQFCAHEAFYLDLPLPIVTVTFT